MKHAANPSTPSTPSTQFVAGDFAALDAPDSGFSHPADPVDRAIAKPYVNGHAVRHEAIDGAVLAGTDDDDKSADST